MEKRNSQMKTQMSVEEFLSDARKTMRWQMPKHKVESALAEAKDHIECEIEADVAQGMSFEEARAKAFNAFGAPRKWANSIVYGCYDNNMSGAISPLIIGGSILLGSYCVFASLTSFTWWMNTGKLFAHYSYSFLPFLLPFTPILLVPICFFCSLFARQHQIKPLAISMAIFTIATFTINGLSFRKFSAASTWTRVQNNDNDNFEYHANTARMKANYERSECDLMRLGLKTYAGYAPSDTEIERLIKKQEPIPAFSNLSSFTVSIPDQLKSENCYIVPITDQQRENNGGASAFKLMSNQIGITDKEIKQVIEREIKKSKSRQIQAKKSLLDIVAYKLTSVNFTTEEIERMRTVFKLNKCNFDQTWRIELKNTPYKTVKSPDEAAKAWRSANAIRRLLDQYALMQYCETISQDYASDQAYDEAHPVQFNVPEGWILGLARAAKFPLSYLIANIIGCFIGRLITLFIREKYPQRIEMA